MQRCCRNYRTGLRHVRGVRPNRAADFSDGGTILDSKIATHCNADQRTRNAATRCVFRAYNAAKCDCGPRCGSLQRSPDPVAGFKGPLRGGERGRERRGWEGRGRERQERGTKAGVGGVTHCDAQLEQGRPLAKAGPEELSMIGYI